MYYAQLVFGEEYASSTLRITLGDENTKEDVDYLVMCLMEVVGRLREGSLEYEEIMKRERMHYKKN